MMRFLKYTNYRREAGCNAFKLIVRNLILFAFFNIKFFLVVFFSAIMISLSSAQERYELLHHLTTEDGLPSNNVYSVIQDRNGFLWFATDQGVVKYDGQKLKVFTTEDGLPTNDIFDLREDRWGRIWMFCKCENISYLRDDKIHSTISDHDSFYFFDFEEDDKGVIFHGFSAYATELNDTLSSITVQPGDQMSLKEEIKDIIK